MLTAILFVLGILGLYSSFVFKFSVFWTTLVICISFTGLLLKLLVLKKKSKKIVNLILFLFISIGIFSLSRFEEVEAEISIYDYSDDVIDVEEQIVLGNSKAENSLNKLEKKYGTNDTTIGLRAFLEALNGNMEDAYALMESFKNKTSIEYYIRTESILMIDLKQSKETRNKKLYNLFVEAANNHPYWERGQQMAGILLYNNNEYDKALYYLLQAYKLDEENAETLYYLGALNYEVGDVDAAIEYFGMAIDNDASEEIISGIAWYVDQMIGEGDNAE